MSEHMTRARWPAYLILLALTATFAWVFLLSIERIKSPAADLDLEMTDSLTGSLKLQITPKLGAKSSSPGPVKRLPQPAPWWPATLFGLAFLCGWLYRQGIWQPPAHKWVSSGSADTGQIEEASEQDSSGVAHSIAQAPGPHTAMRPSEPDLNTDFPWDDSLLDDTQGLTSEEHIARLKKQNASKAEIIKALEILVTENREKWLHQDETEYRLNNHIQTLSDDLKVAIQQLQRLQTDKTSPTGTHKRTRNSQS
ncbi:MAG: hypothetical protein AB8G18_01270 [Gammaproteobacteria bacterium]